MEKKYSIARKKALISVCLVRTMKGKKAFITVCLVRSGSSEEEVEEEEMRKLIKAGKSRTSLYRDELPTIKVLRSRTLTLSRAADDLKIPK